MIHCGIDTFQIKSVRSKQVHWKYSQDTSRCTLVYIKMYPWQKAKQVYMAYVRTLSKYYINSNEITSMQGLLTWTQPLSSLWRTCDLYLIKRTSSIFESLHCPFWIGLTNLFLNSVCVPSRFGLTKLTMVKSVTFMDNKDLALNQLTFHEIVLQWSACQHDAT